MYKYTLIKIKNFYNKKTPALMQVFLFYLNISFNKELNPIL